MPPFKLCATYLAWKRECQNFSAAHNITHSPVVSTDSLVEWLSDHINSPTRLHQCSDFYDVLAEIATRHTTIRRSVLRQQLTSHEGRISTLNHIIKESINQWFSQLTTSHTVGPTLQVEQPTLSHLSTSLHQYLSTQVKWGYFLSSASSRHQLATEWLCKAHLTPSFKPTIHPVSINS